MPDCNGKNGCKIGHPHQYPLEVLLKGKSESEMVKIVARKHPSILAPCGGRALLGRRAVRTIRSKLKIKVSASTTMTVEGLQKAFDDLFLGRMGELKAPGTYLFQGGRPLAFISFDEVTNKIISREIFADMTPETGARVLQFIKEKMTGTRILDET